MTDERWDADQAVTHGPIDAELEGAYSAGRYGVTGDEEIHGEPLSVALAQEEPDVDAWEADDDWLLVDNDFRETYSDPTEHSAEELALHLESP